MTHTPLHSSRGRRSFSQRVDPSLLRGRDNISNIDRGIANPHLGFPRRGLRTGSDPRINNTAGRMMQYSPNPHLERGAIKFAGRPTSQSQASRYSIPPLEYGAPYDDTVTEIPIDTPMINPGLIQKFSTPEENEFSGGVLPDPGQYQNPYFGQKQWNPDDIGGQTWDVDYTTEDITETERPPWDNWFGNLIRNLRGRNRGGLASLKYAR
jgi:hypothetical protein